MGQTHSPVPIAGTGSLELHDDGLTITGFQAGSRAGALLAFVIALVVCLLVQYGLSFAFYLPPERWLPMAIIPAIAAAIVTPRRAGTRPLVLEYPWSAVKKATAGRQPGELAVVVKGARPAGMIHFYPAGDRKLVLDALARRIGASEAR
jgi:hypothetical protein